MNCPNCQSNQIRKNGHRRGKQNYQSKQCTRQFITAYSQVGYPLSVKESCLKMSVNGLGFRAIERITGVNHNPIIRWVRNSALALPNVPDGWLVYPCFVDDCAHLVLKTDITRIEVRNALRRKRLNSIQANGEGEQSRLRHYERSFKTKNLMLLQMRQMRRIASIIYQTFAALPSL